MNPFTARWTATGSNLCLGHWEIHHLGQPLQLDGKRRSEAMGTYGIFSYIFPDDEDYAEGLHENEWITENMQWLAEMLAAHGISADEVHLRWLYQAVNPHDWRCGSCGGCL